MKMLSIDKCKVGMLVAQPIKNDKGQILVHARVKLTRQIIDKLKGVNINFIYIDEAIDDNIPLPVQPIKEITKTSAMLTIEEQLKKIANHTALEQMITKKELLSSFKEVIDQIIEDICSNEAAAKLMLDLYTIDEYTYQHSLNVTIYSLILGRALGLNRQELTELGLGALLHDIGKLHIPYDILMKKGSLSIDEFDLMKEHTTQGFNIMRKIDSMPLLSAHCAYQHHERLDGSGYPRGLRGKEIHIFSRIIMIVDVYDALVTARTYRKAFLPHVAMSMLRSGSGTHFDETVIKLFERNITLYPKGLKLRLTNGMLAVVIEQNPQHPARPKILLLSDKYGRELPYKRVIDLSVNEYQQYLIESCTLKLAQTV